MYLFSFLLLFSLEVYLLSILITDQVKFLQLLCRCLFPFTDCHSSFIRFQAYTHLPLTCVKKADHLKSWTRVNPIPTWQIYVLQVFKGRFI